MIVEVQKSQFYFSNHNLCKLIMLNIKYHHISQVIAILVTLLSFTFTHAARAGIHFRSRPRSQNVRKSKQNVPKRPVYQSYQPAVYQPIYQSGSGYNAPYDPTGHGDPAFSFFQGKVLVVLQTTQNLSSLFKNQSDLLHFTIK